MKIKSINPYTEEVNWTYDSFSIGECRAQIEKSRSAFLAWSSLSAEERAKYFNRGCRGASAEYRYVCRNYYKGDGKAHQAVEKTKFKNAPGSVTIMQKMRLNY